MARQVINIGTSANSGDGEPLRTAFDKCNDNFSELYSITGAGASNNLAISGNKLISEDTNGNIELDPNGTGNVVIATAASLRFTDHTDHAIAFVDTNGDIQFDSKLSYNATTNTATIEDLSFKSATISTSSSSQDIVLDPNGSGTVDLGVPTQTTVGAAGAASALPATPTGYINIKIAGTSYVVPYYAAS